MSFYCAGDDADDVGSAIAAKFHYVIEDGSFSGILNIMDLKALFTILHMTLPVFPIYIAILVLRSATMSKLNNQVNMSENCRHFHTQLLKVGSLLNLFLESY